MPFSAVDPMVPCPSCGTANSPACTVEALKGQQCRACDSPLFTGAPLTLTAASFTAHTAAGALPLVIDFWADWCGPCRSMAPVFAALAAEFEPHVRFAKVDTDAERGLADYFGISTVPTISVIRDRHEVGRIAGALFAGDLRRWLCEALSVDEMTA